MLYWIKNILYVVILTIYLNNMINSFTSSNKGKGNLYTKTCSGQLQQTPAKQRELRCRYVDNEKPFCRIAPFKVEELSLDPYVAYYHESIYDKEIEHIHNARGELERSQVLAPNSVPETSSSRTSQDTFFENDKHGSLNKLERRLEDMTGLSIKTADLWQVINYKEGEYYEPHFDAKGMKNVLKFEGDRILTAVFYISDVELGGATAFPFLHLAVQPIRRSMVMWYNVYRSLDLDYRTLHAGCPVLIGSKWIVTKWFDTIEQEFRRPCDLESDAYK